MPVDVANLIFFSLIGVTSLITSVFISMRFIKKCSSLICTCEQDTTHSGAIQPPDTITPRSMLQMIASKFSKQAVQPVAIWGSPNNTTGGESSSQPIVSKPESKNADSQAAV